VNSNLHLYGIAFAVTRTSLTWTMMIDLVSSPMMTIVLLSSTHREIAIMWERKDVKHSGDAVEIPSTAKVKWALPAAGAMRACIRSTQSVLDGEMTLLRKKTN
jgi:hypothetical protein